MSRMIPPFYEETIASGGEKRLFQQLAGLDDGFWVLHSLGLAEHREKVFGEIDFVVVCEQGILCLEVKSGRVRREHGTWYFTDRYGKEHAKVEGPFRQVISAMNSLRDRLRKRFGLAAPAALCQYASGVVFPDISFSASGPDIIPEIVFDANRAAEGLPRYIDRVFAYWRNLLKQKHGFEGERLGRAQVQQIGSYLRGDFGFVPSLGQMVQQTDARLLALTREQAELLAMADENPHILLKGNAGTGKTLLSLEYARRHALAGRRVMYLCFNKNLARFLAAQQGSVEPGPGGELYVDSFHRYLVSCLESEGMLPPSSLNPGNEYYQKVLPESFIDLVKRGRYSAGYDVLVVDEGQDLLRPEYVLCMDEMVRGGLKEGTWHICYDPNQNLYNPDLEEGLDLIQACRPASLSLNVNCRNTCEIGVYNVLTTGIPPARYFKVRGEEVVRESYTHFADERKKVRTAVTKLIASGVPPGNICLLSHYRLKNSCLQGEDIFRGIASFQDITDLDPRLIASDCLKFCTIQGFKGLESPVIFLLDVNAIEDDKARLLNNTGISRATSLLYIFYQSGLEQEWDNMMRHSQDLLKGMQVLN